MSNRPRVIHFHCQGRTDKKINERKGNEVLSNEWANIVRATAIINEAKTDGIRASQTEGLLGRGTLMALSFPRTFMVSLTPADFCCSSKGHWRGVLQCHTGYTKHATSQTCISDASSAGLLGIKQCVSNHIDALGRDCAPGSLPATRGLLLALECLSWCPTWMCGL